MGSLMSLGGHPAAGLDSLELEGGIDPREAEVAEIADVELASARS
jgi:hypothetical protein